MTYDEFLKLYWKQYLSLERDLLNMGDYVAIDSKNYACFSNNFAKIFMMACSELDSLAGIFADIVKEDYSVESKSPKTFPWKIEMLLNAYRNLHEMRITTLDSVCNLNFVPFKNFTENGADDWWRDYNLVKHNRTEVNSGGKYNYEKANLKNTMTALAALYMLCYLVGSYMNENEKNLISDSNLFDFVN